MGWLEKNLRIGSREEAATDGSKQRANGGRKRAEIPKSVRMRVLTWCETGIFFSAFGVTEKPARRNRQNLPVAIGKVDVRHRVQERAFFRWTYSARS